MPMNDLTSRLVHAVGCLASAVPYFFLVYTLVRVWVDPMSVAGGTWVPFAIGLMALEFVVLHSGAFMATMAAREKSRLRRFKIFAGLALFYGVFAVAFSKATGSWDILQIFGFLMLGRFITLVTAAGEGVKQLMARSAAGVWIYLPVVFSTIFLPVPELGITNEVLNEVYPQRGGGGWARHPERVVFGLAVYFFMMGMFELWQLFRSFGREFEDRAPSESEVK